MNSHSKILIYACAWLIYIIFSITAFDALQITVMLFSIPLTMLGGWMYSYKGALFIIGVTIPYHYLMLKFNSEFHHVHMEAFNLFGILSQLVFSFGTAYLKVLQIKHEQLNHSLEDIVNERTADLTKLTNYLLATKDFNFDIGAKNLLDDPLAKLRNMQESCKVLTDRLGEEKNEGITTAEQIDELIKDSFQSLSDLKKGSIKEPSHQQNTTDIRSTIESLILRNTEASIRIQGSWEDLPKELLSHINPIIQEAVNNALRHASPKTINVELKTTPETYIISIENDGKPFTNTSSEGMGISLMNYHSKLLCASLSQDITVSGNTRVICCIPNLEK